MSHPLVVASASRPSIGTAVGVCAQLVRVPGRGDFVILALDDDEERTTELARSMIEELTI